MGNRVDGIIVKSLSGFYYIQSGEKQIVAKARGLFRKNAVVPLVGDYVYCKQENDSFTITEILPRKNSFVRPPLANLDQIFFVLSSCEPSINTFILDQLIVVAQSKEIEPILVFTKLDLCSADTEIKLYKDAGFSVFPVYYDHWNGDDFLQQMKGRVSAFCGNSGVGKTTLLNHLDPTLSLKTGETSAKLGRGRHTTREVELFSLHGGFIADTPGFSTVQFEKYCNFSPEELVDYFREFQPYLGKCRFRDCTHLREPGCAILQALNNGEIAVSRHQSYQNIFEKLREMQNQF